MFTERTIDYLGDEVPVTVVSPEGYELLAECGARALFDFENTRFLDCINENDEESYLIVRFDGEGNQICSYSLPFEFFYNLVAYYLTTKNFDRASGIDYVLLYEVIDKLMDLNP